jgi:hypothetical protein
MSAVVSPTSVCVRRPAALAAGALVCGVLFAVPPASAADPDALQTIQVSLDPEAVGRAAGLNAGVEPYRLFSEVVRSVYASAEAAAIYAPRLDVVLSASEELRGAWRAADRDGGVTVPMGTAALRPSVARVLKLLRCDAKRDGGRWRIVPPDGDSARQVRGRTGVDPVAIAHRLDGGSRTEWPLPSFAIPLPLAPAAWGGLVGGASDDPLALGPAILRTPRAALLYVGLLHGGRGVLEAATTSPGVLPVLTRYAAIYAAFGGSLHFAGGQLVLPGGPALEGAWRGFFGRDTAKTVDLLEAILSHDQGRLAWYIEALDALDPNTLLFVVGGAGSSPERQASGLKALYAVFDGIVREMPAPGERSPLSRPGLDPGYFLRELRATPDGRLVGPSTRAFWDAVFDTEEVTDTVKLVAGPAADPASLVARVFAPVRQHRYDRADAVAFAQRVFPNISDAEQPDAVTALRGFGRYRALLLTLERMGVTDPPTLANAVRQAETLGAVRDPQAGTVLYCQFQGALALVERLSLVHRLSPRQAHALVNTLLRVQPSGDFEYETRVAQWLESELLPAMGLKAPTDDAPILRQLAGVTEPGDAEYERRVPVVAWLDWKYRVDAGRFALARLTRVRQRQDGSPLVRVLELARIAHTLVAASPESATRIAATLESLRGALRDAPVAARPSDRPWKVAPTLHWAVGQLRGGAAAKPTGRRAVAAQLGRLADVLLADTLRSIAYAPYLGDPDGPLLLGGDVSVRHDFGFTINDRDTRLHAAWSLPEAPTGYGLTWQVWGSLLGLDVGLASLALPRASMGTPDAEASITDGGRKALLQGLALLQTGVLDDADMRRLAACVTQGRTAVVTRGDTAGDAGDGPVWRPLPPGRRRLLRWLATNSTGAADIRWAPSELQAACGGDRAIAWDHWGASQVAWDGSLRLGLVPSLQPLAVRARIEGGMTAAAFPDLVIRIAELATQLQLPAAMVPPLVRSAVQDLLDQARSGIPDDWVAWTQFAAAYPRASVEKAVSSFTADGILRNAEQN